MSRFKSRPGLQPRLRQVNYHVLGALDLIRCEDPQLVSALVRLMENGPGANPTLNPEMALLALGLQRARGAAPLVIANYRLLEDDATAAADRRFFQRIFGGSRPVSRISESLRETACAVSWHC